MRDKGVRIDHGTAGHVDEQGVVAHPGQEHIVDETPCLSRQGHREDHHIRERQQVRELRSSVDTRPCGTPHHHDIGLERLEPAADRVAHSPSSHNDHPPVGERLTTPVEPRTRRHRARKRVEAPQRGQNEADGKLGGAGIVDPARIAEGDPLRHEGQGIVVTSRQQLHDLQMRHA